MGRGDLLRVFINDIDDFLPPREITVTDNRDDALRDATRTHHAAEETS